MIWDYLWLIWIVTSLSFIRFYIYVVAHFRELVANPVKTRFHTPKIIFQITTKGNISIVQETIDRVHRVSKTIEYTNYEIWVVTDVPERFENSRTIIVPEDYRCNADYKARALQFAVRLREEENENNEDTYIFHLDDESLTTEQTVRSILTYIENSPSPISEGLIVYPLREEEKFRITHLFDTLRPFCCFECVEFMSRGKPAYIHGSNLLVRSDIEAEVGWNNGKTIAEDTLFAIAAKRKFGSEAFGWHGGVIEERSPHTLQDLIKQRKRWFYGLIQNLKYLTLKEKLSQISRALLWSSGFLSGIISIVALAIPQNIPTLLKVVFMITSFLWLFSYQIGAFINGKYLRITKRLTFHFLTLISSPLIGMIECFVPILCLVNKPKTFEVIKK